MSDSICENCKRLVVNESVVGSIFKKCEFDCYPLEFVNCSHFDEKPKDNTELSKKAEEELKTGNEPRKFKKCRRCGKKPCICGSVLGELH